MLPTRCFFASTLGSFVGGIVVIALCALRSESNRREAGEIIERTSNPHDIHVFGEGYFRLSSDQNEDIFCRGGTIVLDSSNSLCVEFKNALLRVEPPIQVPHDTKSIFVSPEGDVTVLTHSSPNEVMAIGKFVVYRLTAIEHDGDFAVKWGSAPSQVLLGISNNCFLLTNWRRFRGGTSTDK